MDFFEGAFFGADLGLDANFFGADLGLDASFFGADFLEGVFGELDFWL